MADLTRREFLQKAGASAAGLAAAGCIPSPDYWGEKGRKKREALKAQVDADREKRRIKRDASETSGDLEDSEIREETGIKAWEDNSRIEVQPFLEEEVRSWDEALAAQKYYRKMERRFEFYGAYGSYESFDHFLRAHPQLKRNSEIFRAALKGTKEKNYIKGIQAPREYRGLIEKYGGDHEQFITAIIVVESKFNPEARGGSGEIGLMQVKPSTAGIDEAKLKDPEENIKAGTACFEANFRKLKNEWLALAGYNAGLSRVQESLLSSLPRNAKPIEILKRMKATPDFPKTTRDYLIKIALSLDYIDEQDAQRLASKSGVVGVGKKLRDEYNLK